MLKVKIFQSDLVFNKVFIIAVYRAVYSVLKAVFVLPQIVLYTSCCIALHIWWFLLHFDHGYLSKFIVVMKTEESSMNNHDRKLLFYSTLFVENAEYSTGFSETD